MVPAFEKIYQCGFTVVLLSEALWESRVSHDGRWPCFYNIDTLILLTPGKGCRYRSSLATNTCDLDLICVFEAVGAKLPLAVLELLKTAREKRQ